MNRGSNWLQVGELTDGFGGHELQPSTALAGSRHQLTFDDGSQAELAFGAAGAIVCTPRGPDGAAAFLGKGAADCAVTSLRPEVFFVDFLPTAQRRNSVSLVLDVASGVVSAVLGTLPTREETQRSLFSRAVAAEELTPVVARVHAASLTAERPGPGRRHEPTTDLVGRRIMYDYGSRDMYEHVYLNERFYTWHCLRGPERGLADTDRCYYHKVGEDLYLFVWLEKIVPTLGTVLVDVKALRTTGKIFGYRTSDFGEVSNARVGARAKVLNVTTYG